MNRPLFTSSSLVLVAVMAMLSSCDGDSKSTAEDLDADDDTVSQTSATTVAAPVFSPAGGTYSTVQSVTLATTTPDAVIYYTTDGSTPSESSSKYASPVKVGASKTLKAIAVKAEMTTSSVSTATYVIKFPAPTTGTVVYGGQTYKTVTIGSQTWMAENLNYSVPGDSTDWNLCFMGYSDTCRKYGGHYSWDVAMNGAASSTKDPSGVQGVCPNGWHIPSDSEWTVLVDYAGGKKAAGIKLKSRSWGGTDEFGFNALPAGTSNGAGIVYDTRVNTSFWSTSLYEKGRAWYLRLATDRDSVFRGHYYTSVGYSVRCLKD